MVNVEQDPRNAMVREIRSDFVDTLAQGPTDRHPDGPAKFNRFNVFSNSLPIIGIRQRFEPVANRFATRFRAKENRWNSLACLGRVFCILFCSSLGSPGLFHSHPQCTISGTAVKAIRSKRYSGCRPAAECSVCTASQQVSEIKGPELTEVVSEVDCSLRQKKLWSVRASAADMDAPSVCEWWMTTQPRWRGRARRDGLFPLRMARTS